MADDTPIVAEAIHALLLEIDACLVRAAAQGGTDSGRIVVLIDALIAAVRAENTICSCGTTMICPDIGCDKHKTRPS